MGRAHRDDLGDLRGEPREDHHQDEEGKPGAAGEGEDDAGAGPGADHEHHQDHHGAGQAVVRGRVGRFLVDRRLLRLVLVEGRSGEDRDQQEQAEEREGDAGVADGHPVHHHARHVGHGQADPVGVGRGEEGQGQDGTHGARERGHRKHHSPPTK